MIADKIKFYTGLGMLVVFAVLLTTMFLPIFDGKNGLQYLDGLYNSLSKGSAYFIPELREDISDYNNTFIDVVIEMETERERVSEDIYARYHASMEGLRDWLLEVGTRNGSNPLHNRERFVVESLPDGTVLPAPVVVELVMPMHNTEFCLNCHRIRLTAGGYIKGCLFDKDCVEDLLEPLRDGADDDAIKDLIHTVVAERRPYWTEDDDVPGPLGH